MSISLVAANHEIAELRARIEQLENDQDEWNDVGIRLAMLDRKARAVVAAGKPHLRRLDSGRTAFDDCDCPQCTAWDELKALLEKEET